MFHEPIFSPSEYGDGIVAAWKVIDYTDYIKWPDDTQGCSEDESFLHKVVCAYFLTCSLMCNCKSKLM